VPLLVLSGKGGVGKSTLTSQLAYALAMLPKASSTFQLQSIDEERLDELNQVGCLDLDLCGPSIPIMMQHSYLDNPTNSMKDSDITAPTAFIYEQEGFWMPHMLEENLSVMSISYLLPNTEEGMGESAVIWRGPKKHAMIKQFLKNVSWGTLDYLIIDTPPGTSDEHLSLGKLLEWHPLLCAIIVTTPQEVALQDVRKEIDFCRKLNIPIIGVIENMAEFHCPCCKHISYIFPHQSCQEGTSHGFESAREMANRLNLPFLGCLPLEPSLGKACDQGKSFIADFLTQALLHDSSIYKAFQAIVTS
jgi:Mrp family chromosome partitioning ATPase